ncbi:RNA polymerase sigma factor [Mariniphaga sediminis]|jgi:RNA polymerase sigma-70 factor (ECF subfamily)|uniref:RNA polymerase sigma factor n=1 Tax=Mariniphaga sediminis TaxID=1628158 RepID=UPI0035636E3D
MRIAKNGKQWFKEVFDQNYTYILNYLFYLSGDTELSEDLVQDVFLQLWEKRDEVKQETLRPYLFTIARNSFLKNKRRQKYDMKFRSNYFERTENESPEFILEMKEFDKKLQGAISDLPEKSRVVFLMNRMDEMTYREIAENLGVGVKAVEKQMSRALAILRKKLGKNI